MPEDTLVARVLRISQLILPPLQRLGTLAKPKTGQGIPPFLHSECGAVARCAFPSYEWLLSV
jgi:hypothetical protein